ncbi:MAG: hypothetical protein NWE93_15020 [Candidatus Bathyarchaeota archaeon]|nr:hypothetical protein [Candidatus Bathyarchaeota archaeon]
MGDNLADLSIARSNWSETYVSELSTKIDDAIENYLGLDKKKELRDATGKLATIQVPALRDLSFLKTQLEVDFGNEAKEIKKKLGYDKNLRNVQKGDQETLIQLLYTFKKGMTGDLKTSIVNKGTNVALIDRIIGYADQLKEANVTQETLKETSKEVSGEAVNIFNGIYDEIIGICKIAANYYQYDELKKDQFTFSKVVANMNATRKIGTQGEEIIE